MTYSQGNEEQVIRQYFGDHVGTFLDIGANDGRTFSNTHALALAGWSGVCVDASPRAFVSLSETYAGNDRVQLIHAAVGNTDGEITLDECSDTLVSSTDPSARERWKSYAFGWNKVVVPALSVRSLLDRCTIKTFDLISIDVEGLDMDILRQMDLNFRVLCIEHNDRHQEIVRMCPGYRRIMLDGINLILAK